MGRRENTMTNICKQICTSTRKQKICKATIVYISMIAHEVLMLYPCLSSLFFKNFLCSDLLISILYLVQGCKLSFHKSMSLYLTIIIRHGCTRKYPRESQDPDIVYLDLTVQRPHIFQLAIRRIMPTSSLNAIFFPVSLLVA